MATLQTYLAQQQLLTQDEAYWQWGTYPLHLSVSTYLTETLPPLDTILSVRCIVLHGKQVLVSQNADDTHIVPGGRVEAGEDLLTALCRELLEETGWQIHEPVLIGMFHFYHQSPLPPNYPYRYPDFTQVVYTAQAKQEIVGAKQHDDYEIAAWFASEDDPSFPALGEAQRGLLRVARQKHSR